MFRQAELLTQSNQITEANLRKLQSQLAILQDERDKLEDSILKPFTEEIISVQDQTMDEMFQ